MRAIWTGSIAFGLVNIPVKLYSATQESTLSLDMLDKKDHGRIRYQRVNENTGKEVPWDRIVKGYRYNEEYVILEDEDFQQASPERTKTIDIESFVNLEEVDAVYFESPYFIEPAKGGGKAYALLYKTLEKTKKAGLSLFVMRSTEHLALIRPWNKCLVLQRLRFAEEVRQPDIDLPKDVHVSTAELSMASKLVTEFSKKFDINKYHDDYTKDLLKVIKDKASGKKRPVKKMTVAHTTKNEDLFNQLKASLGSKKRAS